MQKSGCTALFWQQGRGHGTDRAIVAGLLGLAVDDQRIPESFAEAKKAGLSFSFEGISLMNAHPNSVRLEVTGESGRKLEVIGASIGGRTDQNLRDRWTDCKFFRGSSDTGCIQPGQAGLYRKSNVASG